jgi:hypothetical protein
MHVDVDHEEARHGPGMLFMRSLSCCSMVGVVLQ